MHRLWIIPAELFWQVHRLLDALDIASERVSNYCQIKYEFKDPKTLTRWE